MHTAAALTALALVTSTALAQTPSLTIIQGSTDSPALRSLALSRDGSTLGGFATPSGRGFTWTQSGGFRDFDASSGYPGFYAPFALSPDASVVVGGRFSATEQSRAFRRIGSNPVEDLGSPWDASFSQGTKSVLGMWTNQTGTRVIANMQRRIGSSPPEINPFVWTQATNSWQPLIPSQQSLSDYVDANDASDDGTVVVGQVNEGGFFGAPRAFVSTPTGYSILPAPSQIATNFWYATAVNSEGDIIVGAAQTPTMSYALMWRNGVASTIDLNLPGYIIPEPLDVSNDGTVMVGNFYTTDVERRTFVWTQSSGYMTIESYLAGYGQSLPVGASIFDIHLSGDGTTIGGWYQPTLNGNPVGDSRAFVFTIPAPSGLALLGAGAFALTRRRR